MQPDLVADDLNGRPDLLEAFVDGTDSSPKVRLIRRPGGTNVTLLWDYSLGARYRVESQGTLGLTWEPMVEPPLISGVEVSVEIANHLAGSGTAPRQPRRRFGLPTGSRDWRSTAHWRPPREDEGSSPRP